VAVVAGGDLAWSEGFGLADVEQRVPVTRRTRFRLASVSKLLAAAAAARLAEAGRLDLDAPVQRYVPGFPARPGPPVTPRLLAGHLGGVRGYRADDFAPGRDIDQTVYPTTAAALAIFRDDPPAAPPGAAYRYSTFGYTLLGAAVEGAAGEEYTAALRRHVLAPLGLAHTGPDRWDALVPGRTRFYGHAGPAGAPVNERPVFATYKWAGGGMLATADDLARFGAAHLRPGFLSAGGLRALFTPQRTRDGTSTGVGLGWRVGADLAGRTVYHHAGSMEGARSVLLVYPAEGVAVALLTNRTAAVDSPELAAQLLAAPFLPRTAPARRAAARTGGRALVPTPPALRDRARQAGLPMPDHLPVLGPAADDGGLLVVASPLGLHALRATEADGAGELVVALDGPRLRPVTARVDGPRAAAPQGR
jgi:CubicO group peptidase (beta-lactamase class C family)